MANYCFSTYYCTFENKDDAKRMVKDIESLRKNSTLQEGATFQKILGLYGFENYLKDNRGFVTISLYDNDDTSVEIDVESAWTENADFRFKIEEIYNCSINYYAFEPGSDYYVSNNPESHPQFIVTMEDEDDDYLDDLVELQKWIYEKISKEISTVAEAREVVEEYCEEKDICINIYEIEYAR